ncbi:MalM family protein [Vibrio sinaloensis]|uniref:MalM family protein n=1 Tax=Photobacterium sp. (strain ATCC 43367) TaxID=379097 RepID=UPI0022AE792A|nr:MalM family protein [Vibrio sinaloensis]MCZ4293489.1 MalM family protein [Vibrio sinaloensis]
MNNKKSIIALVLGMALTACASTSPQENKQALISPLPYSEVCCTNYSEFPWIQLGTNEELNFQIDQSAPIGHFADGNSYFNSFRLSPRSGRVQIRLSSYMVDGAVFAPKLIALDDHFNVVSEANLDDFSIKASDAFTRTQYQLNFTLDAAKTPYFVIYTPERTLGDSIKVDHPAKVRAKELGEAMPMVTDPTYVYGHYGKLHLSVKTLSLTAYKAKPSAKTKSAVQPAELVAEPVKASSKLVVQPDTQKYYFDSIEKAVASNDLAKALALLEEAKALNVEGAQQVFIKAVNAR